MKEAVYWGFCFNDMLCHADKDERFDSMGTLVVTIDLKDPNIRGLPVTCPKCKTWSLKWIKSTEKPDRYMDRNASSKSEDRHNYAFN